MTLNIPETPLRRTMSVWLAAVTAVVIAAVVLAMTPTRASAVATPVPLGTATSSVIGATGFNNAAGGATAPTSTTS
ncbi:hypothetical protein SAMN05216489_05440 [Streptomyces sp. 3213]|uniref:hypothetical protein n=1 Tax=Streptomyces sp. 3213.3 TaxID=1855348 RepID=UPI00089D4E28|nr:hypothetical protein [Streptomyces sp. 3213.3]SEE08122.1 hypothetical protein SAMN05216489_05440 [Streptomyces sp. 3213] [Streptomyces sp. 3213.3]